MRIFAVKGFLRFQRKEGIGDAALRKVALDLEAGLIGADLGRGLVKQRVARSGQGKRGGYRTIIAYRAQYRAIFVFGFAKSSKANLDPVELEGLARRGAVWLAASDLEIDRALVLNELQEIEHGDDE